MVVVDEQECTGCGICADACPMEAISLDSGIASVDPGSCTECGTCADECPSEAISLK